MTPPSEEEEAKALHERARELAAAEEYGEALKLCRRALELDDDDPAIRATYDKLVATIGPF